MYQHNFKQGPPKDGGAKKKDAYLPSMIVFDLGMSGIYIREERLLFGSVLLWSLAVPHYMLYIFSLFF
jgi:hypothetical protein